jgi:hypothetical protein
MARDRKIVENFGVPEYDTFADLPPASEPGPSIVFVRDTAITYASNGSTWGMYLSSSNIVAVTNLIDNMLSLVYYDIQNTFTQPQLFAGDIKFDATGIRSIGAPAVGLKKLYIDYTNTATVGAVTINKAAGRVNIAAAGTSVVVTNSLVTAASHIFAEIMSADATAIIQSVIPAAGSFTINLSAAATGAVAINFFVVNAD